MSAPSDNPPQKSLADIYRTIAAQLREIASHPRTATLHAADCHAAAQCLEQNAKELDAREARAELP